MGIVYYIESGKQGSMVDSIGFHILPGKVPSAKEPKIIFQASEGPNGGINNTGYPFPTGMTDSAADQAPEPRD